MSYFEIKTIKGNDYLYLRQSVRIGKKVVHHNIGYFGRVDKASRIASGETVTQVRERVQEPKKEPAITQPKKESKDKKEKVSKPKKVRIPGKIREPAQPESKPIREKIDRSAEEREKLLRKKKKKLKKFIRKKRVKKEKNESVFPLSNNFSIFD